MPRSPDAARAALLDAGERLFAERGVDAVSANEIIRTAGLRNKSAVDYHFGGKEQLLTAVLNRHQHRIDRARVELMDEIDSHPQPALRDCARALVEPLAQLLDDPNGGAHYLRIQAALVATRGLPPQSVRRGGTDRLIRKIAQLTGPVDPARARARDNLIATLVLHGLADAARRPALRRHQQSVYVEALIDATVAILESVR
ncbi:MAG: helix-turn-helix domain-containing protein [Acidimicrobiales bacterium]